MNTESCWYKKVCTNENCNENCIRYKLMKSLFSQSQLPEVRWSYVDLVANVYGDALVFQKLSEISYNIVDHVKSGSNLYLFSENCGNGKTSWAIRLMYSYFDKIWHKSCFDCKALYVDVPKFLYNCKQSISLEIKGFDDFCALIPTVDLVIWDDIGVSKITDFEHQILFRYIDERISGGKSNIYTSNKNKQELAEVVGDRLTSRIYNCSQVFEFVEKDKRGVY